VLEQRSRPLELQ